MSNLKSEYAAARSICRRHARSFYFSSFFLPREKRQHAYAVYAFCRGIDDAVDEGGVERMDERMGAFTRTLDSVYAGSLVTTGMTAEQALALRAFAHTVGVCGIPRQYFADVAVGCGMDLKINRYATWVELERYCYYVAGVVGLIMCRVFGLKEESALEQAVKMGNAMQLTNILRDVKEDWDRGRVYLPADEMERFGVTEQQLASGLMTEGLRRLMEFQITRARDLYRQAARGLVHLPDDGSRLTACAMSVIYAGILGAIERQGHNPFAGRARLGFLEKMGRVPDAWRLSRCGAGNALPDVF